MSHNILIGLATIIFLGILAQWVSWRFRLPSILLLLLFGFAAGPGFNFIQPDSYFGSLLFPVVSISVAVILFEGGLNLKLSELKQTANVVTNLISIGIIVTWVLSSAAAYFILQLELQLSILFGAILVVTGPTVILPILRHVKPTGQINSILKWEGIINDPIGALLAILVFEVILSAGLAAATTQIITGLLKTIFLSGLIGFAGGFLMAWLLKKNLIPDFLQNSLTLAVVTTAFGISNIIQSESGLFAVTIMGVYLANQKRVRVGHIIEFKENLRVLLISVLFILLAARLNVSDLEMLDLNSFIFVILLLLVVRPAAVALSTIKSNLKWKEKIYLAWMAPRGIVAAAVTSLFALELLRKGYDQANILVPVMFLVIVVTIAVYGLSAIPLAKWLGIANENPQGCLILGSHPFARAVGKALKDNGIKVLLVDTNYNNISSARMQGLNTHHGSILSENILNDIDLTGIGRLLALTPNKEVNSLAAIYFSKVFGTQNVYQLSVGEKKDKEGKNVSGELRGKILFCEDCTFYKLIDKFNSKMLIKASNLTDKFTFDNFIEKYSGDEDVIPFFLIDEDKQLQIFTASEKPEPKKNQLIIALVCKSEVEEDDEMRTKKQIRESEEE